MDHKIHHGERRSSFHFLRVGSHKLLAAAADKASPVHDLIEDPLPGTGLDDVLREVDLFIDLLSSADDKTALPEVPVAAESLLAKVDAFVARSDHDDDEPLLEAVKRLSSLNDLLAEFNSEKSALHHRVFGILQKATSFLGRRLRALLEDCGGTRALKTKSFGKEKECGLDSPGPSGGSSSSSDDFPGYPESAMPRMRSIAAVMIAIGCEPECTTIYYVSRLKALRSVLNRYSIEKINVDDVPKSAWETLECQISSCVRIVKACAAVYFPAERKLCDSIFSDHPDLYRREYAHLVKVVVTRLLSFVEAVSMTKRSTDKLFKFLDMYECLRDVMPAIEDSYLECGVTDLVGEVSSAKERLIEAAVAIFQELERAIKNDSGRTPVPNGAVHPSTRYVMNYLKYTCEYKSTLEEVFLHSQSMPAPPPPAEEEGVPETPATPNDDGTPKTSPFAVQLMRIMDRLDESLEAKSTLYRDSSLRLVFLMNNGRYVLQKIKGSAEIHELVGDNCYRRRSSAVRKHHKNYTRETWGRLLQTLTHQGLRVTNGKLNSKPLLKERLKNFTAMFEEVHKTQSTWVVSDEQLKSELRASVAAVVIPAYRSFLGRFQQFLDPGRQTEKYIKYQPEDIEDLIEGLFDGNPSALGRKTRH